MNRYAAVTPLSKEPFTYQGRVIVHDNRAEMEWLFKPGTALIVQWPAREASPTIWLRNHPDMAAVTWPLTKEQFR